MPFNEKQLKKLRYMWSLKAEDDRRLDVQQLREMYQHDWSDQLAWQLKSLFSDNNYSKLLSRLDTSINPLRQAADTLANIYAVPSTRTLIDNAEADLSPYENRGMLCMALDRAARLCYATGEILIGPMVDDVGNIALDVIPVDKILAVAHPDSAIRLSLLIVQVSDTRWAIWTDEDYLVVDPAFNVAPEFTGEGDNPYGMIPYVLCHSALPVAGIWAHRETEHLRTATLQAGVNLTDHNHLRHHQSFKQLVIRSDKHDDQLSTMASDPSKAITVRGQGAGAEVLDMQANLREHLETLLNQAAAVVSQDGPSPDSIRGTRTTASSGYALRIENHETEMGRDKQRELWALWERLIYDIAVVVADVHDGEFLPEGILSVSYGDTTPGQNPVEQAELAEKLMADGWSKRRTFRKVWGWTDEEFDENEKELAEQNEASAVEEPPVMVVGEEPVIGEELEA